ncbi:hypothetical protein AZH09_RS17880 [Acinetobacter baumannii]|uniref:hypothetical protein n=1 Tax=Acinetobacter baumannii TaxID=470 RepID=UPI00112AE4A8|nr:hypothetical protein [Acinetobacter baumannii]EHU2204962.1 hypothetical protein [Acinetobacter baumannii]EHU2393307.1 hypothetical protein [Acinetobacter baumannii]EHU2599756.1 hypothetical protein [Acinetobacter baumannii]EIB9601923.1 hypothetical protein [Acinetobacter baumannii]TPS02809.1 hypothetical protein FJV11_18250 [Acinetobacter baumannii]
MATKLGTLTLDLLVRTGKYTEAFRDAEKTTKSSIANITSSISSMKVAWGAAGAAVSLASGLMASKLVAVQREFDVLNAGLITATKSSKDAKIAFDALSQFAKETPYGLSQAVEAFNKLVNLGLTPSEQALMSYGNTASAMGKDLMQLIEAVADASTFEFERLKEFGIKSKQEGDKVKFTFQGVTTEVKKNASDIEQYLIKLGENQFAGAMSERMNTLDGDIAGLEDSWNSLWLSVSQSGVGDLIRVGIQNAATSIDDLTDLVKSGAIETAVAGMGKAFNIFSNGVQDDTDDIGINFSELSKHLIQVWQSTINELNAIGNALNIGKSWVQKAAVGVAAGWDIITDPFNKQSSNSAKQAAYESSIAAIDAELASKKDAVAKAFKNAEQQLAAYTSRTREGRDVLADYKVEVQDSGKETENDAKKTREAARAQEELNRKLRERIKLAKEVLYDYGTEFTRIEADLTKELARFNEASLPSADRSRLIEEAKQISAARKQVYLLEYQQDLDAWNWSEEKKLAKTFEIEKARIDAKVGMSKEERALRKKSLDEQRDDELKSLRLSQEQQLFQIEESYMDEAKALARRYELERQEIEKVRDAKIRAGLLNASARAEDNEYEDRRRNAFVNFQSMSSSLNGSEEYFNLDKELEDRRKIIADALKWNNITEDEARTANLAAEKKYLQDRLSLHFMYGESIAESTADTMKTVFGEQSAAYKAMFAIQKGFAIAQSMIAIQQGIANAMSLPFPANLAAAATVAAETASIIGNIKAIGLTGMAHDGIASVPEEGTWLLNKGERVLNPQDNQAFTNFINEGGSRNPTVNVYTLPGQTATATQNDDGSLDIRIQQVAEQTVATQLANPNSRISKTMQQNYNAQRRR